MTQYRIKLMLTISTAIFLFSFGTQAAEVESNENGISISINELLKYVIDDSSLSQKWEMDCEKDDLTRWKVNEEDVKRLVRLTTIYGIDMVRLINENLANAVYYRLQDEKIRISCDANKEFGRSSATHYQVILFGKKYYYKKIWIGKLLNEISSITSANYNKDTVRNLFEELSYIFHEILHTSKLDNNSTFDHNFNLDTYEKRQLDVVYACSDYAFLPWSVFYTEQACITCSLARVAGAKTIVDNSKNETIRKSKSLCEAIDQPYL